MATALLELTAGFSAGAIWLPEDIWQETQETQVQSLGQEDFLEYEIATPSSILDWKIPWTEEPDGLQSGGCKESDMTEHTHIQSMCIYVCVGDTGM